MLKAVFERDYSLAHCCIASAVTFGIFTGRYIAAVVAFFIGVAVCVAGEIALERR